LDKLSINHWSVSIIASAPFGFGMFAIFVGVFNYLIDAYTIYAASVFAANLVLRYIFAAQLFLYLQNKYMIDLGNIYFSFFNFNLRSISSSIL
jgi:hypothetical protein